MPFEPTNRMPLAHCGISPRSQTVGLCVPWYHVSVTGGMLPRASYW